MIRKNITMAIILSDDVYGRVLKVIGYPIITLEDISGGSMTRQQLQDIVLKDALLEYWSWFPKKNVQEYSYSGQFEMGFPNATTIGILDYRVVQQRNGSLTSGGNSWLDIQNIQSVGSSGSYGGGMFGTKYNYDMNIAYESRRQTQQAVIDRNQVVKIDIDYSSRKIIGYTNLTGKLNITWAEYSEEFSDIPMGDRQDVIRLMQSYLLFFFGDLRNQTADNTPSDIDGSEFVSRASDLKEEVLEKWKSKPKIVVRR